MAPGERREMIWYGMLAITAAFAAQTGKPVRGVPVFEDTRRASVKVTVRPASDVSGKAFTIGEIADIAGADRTLAKEVAAVEAGTSPLPGLSRTVAQRDILARLRFSKIDASRVEIVCPAGVRIRRAAVEAPNADIVKAAMDALAALGQGAQGETTVEALPLTTRLFVSPGKLEYRAGTPHGQLLGGMAGVPVTVVVDGQPAKTVDVLLRIRRSVTAVVAARTIAPHETLTASDVATAPVEATRANQVLLTNVAAAIGKRTTRQIPQGAPIAEASVEAVPVVVTGARVTVEIAYGGVKICAAAVARGPGGVGDSIRVVALDTRKELTGVVVDANTVRVEESR